MAKFSDLDPKRQRHLVIILRVTQMAIAHLSLYRSSGEIATRMMLVAEAESNVDQLSDARIADLVEELDEAAQALDN